jgi:hypothetical protein
MSGDSRQLQDLCRDGRCVRECGMHWTAVHDPFDEHHVLWRQFRRKDDPQVERTDAMRVLRADLIDFDTDSFIWYVAAGAELLDVQRDATAERRAEEFERRWRGVVSTCLERLVSEDLMGTNLRREALSALVRDDDRHAESVRTRARRRSRGLYDAASGDFRSTRPTSASP